MKKFGIKEVINDYGEHRQTRDNSIVFKNNKFIEPHILPHHFHLTQLRRL